MIITLSMLLSLFWGGALCAKTPIMIAESPKVHIVSKHVAVEEPTPEKKATPTHPRVAIVLIIDQFAYHSFQKYAPYAQDGFKMLMNEAIFYTNISHPHGNPTTGTGHTAIVSGALPFQHGIIDNHWIDTKTNKIVNCDEDSSPDAAIFNPNGGMYKEGKSNHFVAVDTIPDQFALCSHEQKRHHSMAFSVKSRSANMPAGKAGKAIWLDDHTGKFTSSKAYFDELPSWMNDFNGQNPLQFDQSYAWKLMYKEDFEGYQFPYTQQYSFTAPKKGMAGSEITFSSTDPKGFDSFVLLPYSNKHLLNLVTHYVDAVVTKNTQDRFFMTVSLSSFDLIGHVYGQDSLECIDTFLHLDRHLGDFIRDMQKKIGATDVCFALTGDHGTMPIPEVARLKGVTNAKRIVAQDIVKKINREIGIRYGFSNLVIEFNSPNLFLDEQRLSRFSLTLRDNICETIKTLIYKNVPGIVHVWCAEELLNSNPIKGSREELMKNSLYPGRSGQIICLLKPYHQLTLYDCGTGHCTPYWHDLQVPLFIYQKGQYTSKRINNAQLMTQFAATMAHILGIQKPSASNPRILKGIA